MPPDVFQRTTHYVLNNVRTKRTHFANQSIDQSHWAITSDKYYSVVSTCYFLKNNFYGEVPSPTIAVLIFQATTSTRIIKSGIGVVEGSLLSAFLLHVDISVNTFQMFLKLVPSKSL